MFALLIITAVCGVASAQGRGGGARAGGAPPTARAQAPKDFAGYWVAVVTEHWHLRMEMPPKGEFAMLPLNPAARDAANKWTPAEDSAGNECRSYGAASIMRRPRMGPMPSVRESWSQWWIMPPLQATRGLCGLHRRSHRRE